MTNQNNRSILSFGAPSIVLLSLSMVAGCSTAVSRVDTRAEFDAVLPTSWEYADAETEEINTDSLTRWWLRFGDPQLESLVSEALLNNQTIGVALSSIRQARAERGLEQAELWPSLDVDTSAAYNDAHDRAGGNSSKSESYNVSLDAGWEIGLFGKQAQYINASSAELAKTVEDYNQARVSLAAEVATTYFALTSYESQLAIVYKSLETRKTTFQLVQWQEQVGEGDALSTQQSITSIEQARSQIPDLEQNIIKTRNSLAVLTGRTPHELMTEFELPERFPKAPELIAVGIPSDTLRQRPDIRAAEQSIVAAQANLTATELTRLPSLNLKGSFGVDTLSFDELIDPQYIISNIAAGLTAPIWNAGKITRNIEIRNEILIQSYLNYESVVLEALGEVENALSLVSKSNEKLDILSKASEAARLSTKLAQMEYESGEEDLITVLDAQRTELSLEQTRISSQADTLSSHVQLYKTLGGGWSTQSTTAQL